MDPFTEKEIVDCMKSMAVSLRNIDRKMDDIALSLREFVSSDDVGDVDEIENVEDSVGNELGEDKGDVLVVKVENKAEEIIDDGFKQDGLDDSVDEVEDIEDEIEDVDEEPEVLP